MTIFGFIGAAFFHGPLILGGIIFLLIVLLRAIKSTILSLANLHLNTQSFVLIIFALGLFYSVVSNQVYIPKLGYFEEINLGYLISESKARMIGNASYGEILYISSITDLNILYKIPLRFFYFLFSPLPWDVQKLTHLIGMLDGFVYMFLVYLILSNLKVIMKDPFLRIVLIILICYTLMFAFGVSNFGAGLRHRTKFFIFILLLAAPFISKSVFIKKK